MHCGVESDPRTCSVSRFAGSRPSLSNLYLNADNETNYGLVHIFACFLDK
jgi:hypothetical protein